MIEATTPLSVQEVTITGDFWLEQGRTGKLVKDEQGVWSVTIGPFFPDIYSYAFTSPGELAPLSELGITEHSPRLSHSAGPRSA